MRKHMKRKQANLDEVTPEPFKYLSTDLEEENIDDSLKTLAIIKPTER